VYLKRERSSRRKMAVKVRDMKDKEDSERIGVETPHGLVLLRFYENGSISIGHTDPSDIVLKPRKQGSQAGVVIEWLKH
jgi:hypothetical protein